VDYFRNRANLKKFHFLAGLPRSGSTVLAALLNQHPSLYASATSGLGELMFNTFQVWKSSSAEQASSEVDQVKAVLRGMMDARYSHIDKPVVIDKARNWAEVTTLAVLKELLPYKPKIIATVRNVEDCAASFVRIANPTDLEDFLRNNELIAHLKNSYQVLQSGYNSDKSCFLFIEYEDLLKDPQKQLRRIEDFLELPAFEYDFNHLDKTAPKERDEEVWNLPGLHDIKPELKKQHNQDSKDVLEHMYRGFVQPCFWRNNSLENKEIEPLEMQLALSLMGDFEGGEKILQELAFKEPKNHRAAFNRGWYELRKGHLLDGMTLINRGRIEKVFGNESPKVPTATWDGKQTGTALLNLEGGLGDQIHGLRFARELKRLGNQVIVACSGPLAMMIRNAEGVDMVVQHEAIFGVVHDFWVPSMTAPIPLKWQYKDIDGSPYISCPDVEKSNKVRIGLRWQGNPQFEHEQHRLFPSQFMFNAVEGLDVEYINLQRDAGSEHRPDWIQEVDLTHWDTTAKAIASCDLVITSCTSVAHLSGAMGIPTWIIVPVLPYYLWAKPGNGTEWYDSVKLFRQKQHGDWVTVFNTLKKELHHAYENGLLDSDKKRTSIRRMGLQTIG
jgi:hypothetical protein